jgi:hypothetical protein
MSSVSETGHNKNVTNLETLIIRCEGFGTSYNPSSSIISIPNLTTYYQESKQLVKDVKITEAPFNEVEGRRKLVFKPLKPTGTKFMNALKGANAPSTVIADAETVNRKLQGKRADNSTIETPIGETPKDKVSVSQQSYEMQVDHFEKLIEIGSIEPSYNPNEIPLKVATLSAYKDELLAVNTEVKTKYVPYINALKSRNAKLYNPETGIVNLTQMVKNYVKSVFGASSAEYKSISKLTFKDIK